jgi:uncharacterized protein (TIGR00255 family)
VIRSMTGFASVSREDAGARVSVTAKSVNHRFLDVALKAPQALAPIESRLKALVSQRLTRGRIEISIGIELSIQPEREVTLDEALLDRIGRAIDVVRAKGLVSGTLSASDVLRLPQVLEIRTKVDTETPALPEPVAALAEAVMAEALDALVVMRETEGRFLETDLNAKLATLIALIDDVEREAMAGQQSAEERLRTRLADLPADLQGDAASVAQEIVRFIARSDVDEELVRLRSHVGHWRSLAGGPEPCGRKLDFLVQELNREINTIGSKAEGTRAPEIVIGVKAELERIREQVQNVE